MKRLLLMVFFVLLAMPVNVMALEYAKKESTEDIPVITFPKDGQVFTNNENIIIEFDYEKNNDCYVQVSGVGSIFVLKPVDNKATISKGKLGVGGDYGVVVSDGNVYSEPVSFSVDNDGDKTGYYNDIQDIVNNVDNPDISRKEMFPKGFFTTEEEAEAAMKEIEIDVWQLKDISEANSEDEEKTEFEKCSTTMYVTVNSAVADKVTKIFEELYEMEFPVKYAGGFCWRNTNGARLSEHAIGTAIDINYEENYCLYSDGSVTGELYEPGVNPYSVTDEVVAVFEKYGFYWGGNWDSPKDYMHFSYYNT